MNQATKICFSACSHSSGRLVAALLLAISSAASVERAVAAEWIDTWSAATQPVWGPDFLAGITFPRNLWNQTMRQVARVSLGGKQLRITLSNEYGSVPMVVGEA